jgi:hypothetical protein
MAQIMELAHIWDGPQALTVQHDVSGNEALSERITAALATIWPACRPKQGRGFRKLPTWWTARGTGAAAGTGAFALTVDAASLAAAVARVAAGLAWYVACVAMHSRVSNSKHAHTGSRNVPCSGGPVPCQVMTQLRHRC